MSKQNKASDLLISSIKRSELLLAYATEHGIEVNREQVQIITEAKYAFDNNDWTIELEIDFWIAYKQLSKLIQPVTVESLSATQEIETRNKGILRRIFRLKLKSSLMHSSVRSYTFSTLFIMLLMVAIHIFFFIGTTRLNKIQATEERIKEIDSRMYELMMMMKSENQDRSITLENQQLDNERFTLDYEKKSNIELLKPWIKVIRWISLSKKEFDEKNSNETENEFAIPDPNTEMYKNIELIEEAENYVIIIGIYILPLFFGLVGAFAFVLRDLVQEIRNLTFSNESNIKYLLRIQLGALAGLAIGLFWGDIEKQQEFGFMSSLSPLLIAFIAGYGVEYVFTFIEKSIASILKRNKNNDNTEK